MARILRRIGAEEGWLILFQIAVFSGKKPDDPRPNFAAEKKEDDTLNRRELNHIEAQIFTSASL